MGCKNLKRVSPRFLLSKKGIAIPVTFLMLFVSLTFLISITYCFAVIRVNSEGELLMVSAAKKGMLSLENSIETVSWSPGSSETCSFDDYGGKFRVEPEEKRLIINVTDGSFSETIFNSAIGKLVYELTPSKSQTDNIFLKGDNRAIINQSSSPMAQLYISPGSEFQEVTLCYRPFASSAVVGSSDGKPVNNLRIYIINLNSSQSLTLTGEFRLKVACVNVASTLRSYNFSYQIESLMVKVNFDGVNGTVSLPVSSNAAGAIVKVEIVTCNVKLQNLGG